MKQNQRVLTAKQAKLLDLRAEEKYGLSTLLLMENAGRAVSQEALRILENKSGRVAIFCGHGNNGGDGFCTARHLLAAGVKPDLFLAGKISAVEDAAKTNLGILLKLKQKVTEISPRNIPFIRIAKYSLIIDALLGVGVEGEVKGIFRDLITLINSSSAQILSVDIPSGLDATSGKILGCCIRADKTITFVAKKSGMLKNQGRLYCGKIVVVDLGAPL